MLSTLSSFLPSVLTDRLDKPDLRSDDLSFSNHQQKVVEDGVVKRMEMAAEANKKEKKKKSSSNEASTFIVVRPPPAKSNHPLNLQLQLVPAYHSRDRSNTSTAPTPTVARTSTDFGQGNDSARPLSSPSASESEHALKRTPSIRSNRSDTSGFYASSAAVSTGSVTSFASTTSTSSGRRMIIPLYNLSAHNVMTNTILDAGTDARVAKFNKRGLELIDLAILEPTEVWSSKDHAHCAGVGVGLDALEVPICRSCSGNSSLAPPGRNGSRAGTPDPAWSQSPASSGVSVASDPSSGAGDHSTSDPATTPTATPTGTKKLFGRLFRKKEGSGSRQQSPSMSGTKDDMPPPRILTSLQEPRPGSSTKQQIPSEVLLPAVLGLSPTLSAATNPPTGRCVSYVWMVRKWLKVETQNRMSGVLGKKGREASTYGNSNPNIPDVGGWEVRFEWVRGKSKGEKARRGRRQTGSDVGTRNRSQTSYRRYSAVSGSEDTPEQLHQHSGLAISVESPRQSLDVTKPTSRTPSPRGDTLPDVSAMSTNHSDDDTGCGHAEDGDESDPEDSETPWVCSMILSHSSTARTQVASLFIKGQSRTRTISSGATQHPTTLIPDNIHASASDIGHGTERPNPIRIKVGTLSPAPHHPKVVCQLKIPFPLPDVEVSIGELRRRLVLADGSTRSTIPLNRAPGMQNLTLSAEEIKDVVCSTAFWIIVREGFGGVGKKSRKGDGWKIRG